MHDVFLVLSAVALISGLVALCIRSSDVPARERAMAAPTRAGLSSAERGRAQLVPGPSARQEGPPGGGRAAAVVHAEVVHAEVAPAPSPLTEPGGTPVETHAVFTTPPDDGFDEPSSSDTFPPGPTTVDVRGAYPAGPCRRRDGARPTMPGRAR